MKRQLSFLILLICVVIPTGVLAQAKRIEPRNDAKKNQREIVPEPTPIPSPTPLSSSIVKPGSGTVEQTDDGEVIKVNTQLVSVPVRVMDKKGRFIGGLDREKFKVFEDGKEQEIALFSNEHEPFTVALVLDMSYSTSFKIAEIQSAAIAFIEQLRPQDRILVVSFDGDVHILCEATGDRKEIFRAIKSTKITTGTSLYEAIDVVMNRYLRQVEGRKAIILFSDGVDTTSRRSNDSSNLHDAMELDSLIYTIRYDTFSDVQNMKNTPIIKPPKITIPTADNPLGTILGSVATAGDQGTTAEEYAKAAEYLNELSRLTGGRRYDATSLGNLADAYSKIASELREFYSVGYYPSEDRVVGKSSNVKVKVSQEGLVVRSRETFSKRRAK